MKKVSISAADAIIGGGTQHKCSVEYVKDDKICNAVQTCLDKNGKEVSSETTVVDAANCA